MGKYDALANQIVKYVGGKDNVQGVIHCVTRLRFTLVDESKVDKTELDKLDGVISSLSSGGQFQVVIGNQVADVYQAVIQLLGLENSKAIAGANADNAKGLWTIILDIVSNVFTPILPILCASGMIKGLNVLASYAHLYEQDSSWYVMFNGFGDALFFFFPIFIGYTSAKKFGLKPLLGMVMGAMLSYPTLNGSDLNFFGNAFKVSYTATVLPIIVLVAIAAPIEKYLDKKLPIAVRSFLSPLIVMLSVVPIGYLIIGPGVNTVASSIGTILTSIYDFNPVFAGFVIAALYSILVVFGVHGPLMMLLIMNIMSGTPDGIYAVVSAQSFAITGTLLGIWLKTKDKKLKSNALGSWITSIFGVTEPAIYGILLPRIKFFIVSCIGAGFGGAYLALMNIKAYQMAGLGIFRIPAFLEPGNVSYSLTHVLIGYLISIVISFAISFTLYKDENTVGDILLDAENDSLVFSPIEGKVINLKDVDDAVFSKKMMGEGIAIVPSKGEVYAPFDGEVTLLFPTLHAIGFKSVAGCEVLVHVGLDTVNLEGKYFESYVKQGDSVRRGQLVLKFDKDAIQKAGYNIETPVVITNSDAYSSVDIKKEDNVSTDGIIMSYE